ncbi:MAG: TetR/AcrR family transcriptional regulator [Paludibacteraceae bacterium]|nr:TetR/AcrR family transcriptional regulator [Paludibacteraceae bacterium]
MDIREKIIELAMEKMKQVGIKSISIDDLCHEIGISKKTFYVYFDAKDDLVAAMLRKHEDNLVNGVKMTVEGKTVLELLLSFMQIAGETKDVRRVPPLVHDLKKYYPILYKEHLERVRTFARDIMREQIARGVEEGLFRADLDVEKTATIMSFAHNEMLNVAPTIPEDKHVTAWMHTRYALDIFMRGIISEQGKRLIEEKLKI